MRYRRLGPLQVSLVGLGCINFGRRVDQSGTNSVVDAALAAGVTFFDTADRYGGAGKGESMLGVALRGRRDQVVLATKFGMSMGDGALRRGSRDYIRHSIEGSLRRLETDYIDLYQHHEEDPGSPLEETIAALEELVQEGKVRAYGTSNYRPEALAQARAIGGNTYVSEQSEYSWLDRRAETHLLPCCRQLGLAFIPYAPLYSGLLSGAVGRHRLPAAGTRLHGETIPEHTIDLVETLAAWAAERGRSLLEVAIGGLAAAQPVVSVIAGATTAEHVRANAAAGSWEPTELELSELLALTP